jgi:hypothetical protein
MSMSSSKRSSCAALPVHQHRFAAASSSSSSRMGSIPRHPFTTSEGVPSIIPCIGDGWREGGRQNTKARDKIDGQRSGIKHD